MPSPGPREAGRPPTHDDPAPVPDLPRPEASESAKEGVGDLPAPGGGAPRDRYHAVPRRADRDGPRCERRAQHERVKQRGVGTEGPVPGSQGKGKEPKEENKKSEDGQKEGRG